MNYCISLGHTLNGGDPIWQVWDATGCLVFVTVNKTEAEEWIDRQLASQSPTTCPTEPKKAG